MTKYAKLSIHLQNLKKALETRIEGIEDAGIQKEFKSISNALDSAVRAVESKQILAPSEIHKNALTPYIAAIKTYQSYKASLPENGSNYEFNPHKNNYLVGFDYKIGKWDMKPTSSFYVPANIYFATPADADLICNTFSHIRPTGPKF